MLLEHFGGFALIRTHYRSCRAGASPPVSSRSEATCHSMRRNEKKPAPVSPNESGRIWTYLDSRQQWTAMDSNGQQWTAMDSNGQQWTAMDSNGQQWTAMDSNGQQWTAMDSIAQDLLQC